ncbi:MAG: SDR family oxidoreductase [Chloroflexi bacterium]|nr:SDR family oxidoreductase [Chloroflexota bacterium]
MLQAVQQRVSVLGARLLHRPETLGGDPVGSAAVALGGLDVVVRWAPSARPMPVASPDHDFAGDIDRMLVGAHRVAVAATRAMGIDRAGRGTGSIVLVGSIDATHAYPGRSAASTAMAGMLGLVRSLGVELASQGVRANAVLAGPMGDDAGGPPPDIEPSLVERMTVRSPVHRFVTADEVAAAICFVAGPTSDFMTGQTLSVDGGWSALNQAPQGMRFP